MVSLLGCSQYFCCISYRPHSHARHRVSRGVPGCGMHRIPGIFSGFGAERDLARRDLGRDFEARLRRPALWIADRRHFRLALAEIEKLSNCTGRDRAAVCAKAPTPHVIMRKAFAWSSALFLATR